MIVGYVDNVLTARAFATRNGYRIDANQELLALGMSNLATGVTQGFPVSSSGSRTVIGDSLGSRTQLHSLVALATMVLALVFLRPGPRGVPDRRAGSHRRVRRAAADRPASSSVGSAASGAASCCSRWRPWCPCWSSGSSSGSWSRSALSIADLLRRVARPHDGILGFVPGTAGMHDIDDYPEARLMPGLVVYRYDSPLFFANAEDFRTRALAAVEAAPEPVEWFVLNAEANVEVDLTALDAVEELRAELARRGVVFAMARVKQDLRDELDAAGLVDRVGAERIYPTLPTAVQAYVDWHTERHGRPPAA